MDWGAFFAMGGRGFFIWGSYVVALIVVAFEVASVLARRRRALASIREEMDIENEATP